VSVSMRLAGFTDTQQSLHAFMKFGERGLAKTIVRAGLRVVAQQMRQDIDPKIQDVSDDVGYRLNRQSGTNTISGKSGVGVAKTVSRGKPGIHSGTWHWWVLGSFKTMNRRTRTGANRGRMPAQQPDFADRAKQRAQQRARAAMEAAMGRSIERFFSSR
jgi:hypothetical protein